MNDRPTPASPSPPPAPSKWLRVSRSRPCPVCGKPDWCGVAADGSAAACMRVEVGGARRLRNGAWLHRFGPPTGPRPVAGRLPVPTPPPPDAVAGVAAGDPAAAEKLRRLMGRYRRAAAPAVLDGLAAALGLSSRRPLEDLGAGWSDFHPGLALPARDARGRLVGVQIRHADGAKRLLRGSRQGLFLPADLARQPATAPLVICEGASDAAASLDLAHRHREKNALLVMPWRTAGRPNWACGGAMLLELVTLLNPDRSARVVIMADVEPSGDGRRGARELADLLRPAARSVRVLVPAAGAKDLRERVRAGLTPAAFAAAVGGG